MNTPNWIEYFGVGIAFALITILWKGTDNLLLYVIATAMVMSSIASIYYKAGYKEAVRDTEQRMGSSTLPRGVTGSSNKLN